MGARNQSACQLHSSLKCFNHKKQHFLFKFLVSFRLLLDLESNKSYSNILSVEKDVLTLLSTGGFWTDFSKCSERG